MGMAVILITGPYPFEQIFNPPLIEGSTWSLKKTGPEVSEEKSFKVCMDDGWQVITIIGHPEPSASVS